MEEIKLTDAVVIPVMKKHGITREEAEKRLQLLYQSNILETGSPNNPEIQMMIDGFLAQSSDVLGETVLFEKCFSECLKNEGLIKEYDRLRPKAHMAYTIKQIQANKMNKVETRQAKRQFEMFEKFVREYIFSRLER